MDLGAEFVVGDGRRDDSGQQSRPLAQPPLLFRLFIASDSWAHLAALCGWGGGQKDFLYFSQKILIS